MSRIQVFHHQTADEFLNAISPRSEIFRDAQDRILPRQFIFRGVGNAREYNLIPSAFREKFLSDFGNEQQSDWNNLHQVCTEWRLLKSFFECADANGLPLPEDSQKLREEIEIFYQSLKKIEQNAAENEDDANNLVTNFPSRNFLTLLALAQHHGLPTRLMDWSRTAFTASYFAAQSAVRQQEKNAEMGVWAFQFNSLEWTSQVTHLPLQIITAPNVRNGNLKAQRGLFTLYRPEKIVWKEAVDRRPFDEIAQEIEGGATILKFTLPVVEAPRMLYLLSLENITGATMFPDYDGVVRSIREMGHYPRD